MKLHRLLSGFCVLSVLSAACGSSSGSSPGGSGRFQEGKDYVVLERVRLLDEMGFDRPVEAMSVLAPRGWRTEGGVTWRGVQECRGEFITWKFSTVSPDGAIRLDVAPVRSFGWFEDPMMRRSMETAAAQGGCAVNQPFDAAQYLDHIAGTELGGATVSDVKRDDALMAVIDRITSDGNRISQQYGNGIVNSGSAVHASLSWPDGTAGLANIGVTVAQKDARDMFTGRPNGFSTTTVFFRAVMRFPADRREEAVKLYGTILSSHRMNPVWTQAKDRFLTELGNLEHRGRMERLRLMGEQAAAYAKSASEASDARMRSWEAQNAASDRQQHRFIQTIREVETWKDSSGSPVELSAGYAHGWSRPDGAYILTNNSLFDPAVEFQQNWVRMEKQKDR
jgi:hypothetical protein